MAALFTDYTFQTVAMGSVLLGIVSGVLGSFAVLRRESLLGDAVSHAALPGVVIAFLLTGSKNTEILLLGAAFTAILASYIILGIVKSSSIKFDSVLAVVMSVFFGLGLVLLTYSQKIPNANQAGLKNFIYGQASTMLKRDVCLIAVCGTILLIITALFWKEFKLISFDKEYAATLGFNCERLNLLLSFLIVMTVIIGIQTVGVVLMSAMLIAPSVAARQWSNRLWVMVTLSAIFGAVSGVLGTALSCTVTKLPTGPAITLCATLAAVLSILFAPKRGILYKEYRHRKIRMSLK